MTLSSEVSRVSFSGSGSPGPFAFPFKVFSSADLEVYRGSTLLTLTTHYSVSGVGDRSGGTVTLTSALLTGETLTIRRAMDVTQPTNLRNQGTFQPEMIEDALDRLTMIDQWQQDQVDRSVRIGVTADTFDLELPTPEAGKAIAWDGSGAGFANVTLDGTTVALPAEGRTTTSLTAYLLNGAVYNVLDYGAVGDGVTNDTAAIQAAIVAALPERGTVYFPPGRVYVVTSVNVYYGITFLGYGATLFRPANQPNFTRMLRSTVETDWNGAADSPPLVFKGLTLDGNIANQGAYTNYELQHNALFFLFGDPANTGRLRVTFEDITMKGSTGDGFGLHYNVDAKIVNCHATDCWRGGLVVTGGWTKVQITNFVADGALHQTGIDIEVDPSSSGSGFGGSKAVDIIINGMHLKGDFDVSLLEGSTFIADNIITDEAGWFFTSNNAVARISNSRFHISSGQEIRRIGDLTYDNCDFIIGPDSAVAATTYKGLHLTWQVGATVYYDQTLRLNNCRWYAGPNTTASDTLYALYTEQMANGWRCRILIDGGEIPSTFDFGIRAVTGIQGEIKNITIKSPVPIYWTDNASGSGSSVADLVLDNINNRGAGRFMGYGFGSALNTIVVRNMVMAEADAKIDSNDGGVFTNNTHIGGKTILVATSPVGRAAGQEVPGAAGDVCQLLAPVAGATWRWVCTTGSATTAAVWKPEAALGA